MRQHWSEKGAVTAAARSVIASHIGNGLAPANAAEWLGATDCAVSFGVHIGPPPTPIHDEMARLTEAGDAKAAVLVQVRSNAEWQAENQAIRRWRGLEQSWINLPTPAEQQAKIIAQKAAADREEAIAKRTAELLASDEEQQRQARTKAARARAEKEIGQ